ncbi:protein pelota [Gonapodya prolifera JEL478]|uniref:Protein DOM34 homolog n=1 Tax=Gonapodya prolifera (strain JEL478) TaxID=1344416 RepID=A0A138ZZJ1_GONPJ|nr:protein pelota [Gonapodya prolifera JEL478]|eukprot:KXS09911.1 protein pelota [Gonapodya prolifera JEL478]
MKLIRKYLEKDSSGSITLCPEETEDMWHTYNLIQHLDILRATAIRKVVSESSTGTTDKTSVRMQLTIQVESVDFDTQGGVLSVKGRNVEENKFVKMGQYHTLDLELNRNFTLTKPFWDSIALQQVMDACDPSKRADIAAVVLQEGLAQVCLVTQSMTIVRARIEVAVPRKRKGMQGVRDKATDKFFEQVVQAILKYVDFEVVKVLVLASPGFVKDQLSTYIQTTSLRLHLTPLLHNKSKIVLAHCSSAHLASLSEALLDPSVAARVQDTRYSRETKEVRRFWKMLDEDPGRAWYGFGHVKKAIEAGGQVEVLMVTDALFRSADIPTRRSYVELVEGVKCRGGDCLILSTAHGSGEQLGQLGGVAAILAFSVEIDEDESERGESDVDN